MEGGQRQEASPYLPFKHTAGGEWGGSWNVRRGRRQVLPPLHTQRRGEGRCVCVWGEGILEGGQGQNYIYYYYYYYLY